MSRRVNKHFDVRFRRIRSVLFCRKVEKTPPMREETDGEVFLSCQSRHFSLVNKIIKVLSPIFTSTWCVNSFDYRLGKSINRRNENTFNFFKYDFGTLDVLLHLFEKILASYYGDIAYILANFLLWLP